MNANFLHPLIMEILGAHPLGVSEYHLMKALTEGGVIWPEQSDSAEHALFQKHFMIMNALYMLQDVLSKESIRLEISAIKITLHLADPPESIHQSRLVNKELVDNVDYKLKAYYLDWANYQGTGAEEVSSLLNQFWSKYAGLDKRLESFQILGVPSDSTRSEMEVAYRRLAAKHHPDKGGSAESFIQIRQAYEVLSETIID